MRSEEAWGVSIFAVLLAAGFLALWRLVGAAAVVPAVAVAVCVVLMVVLESSRRIRKEISDQATQLQHVLGLLASLQPDRPLPPLGGSAIDPDGASVLVRHVLHHRPRLIVEAGSGSSTVVAGCCLRKLGGGRIVALEQHARFADLTRRNLEQHGLAEFAEVRHAPLEPQEADGRRWMWFARAAQRFDRPIDLVLVDGPTASRANREARFPALPILSGQLSDEAWIIVDDARRRGERRILKRWQELFPNAEVQVLPTRRGTAVIRLATAGGRK